MIKKATAFKPNTDKLGTNRSYQSSINNPAVPGLGFPSVGAFCQFTSIVDITPYLSTARIRVTIYLRKIISW